MAGKLVSPTRYKADSPQSKHATARQSRLTLSQKSNNNIPLQVNVDAQDRYHDNSAAVHLPKAASYTNIPAESETQHDFSEVNIKRAFSEGLLHQQNEGVKVVQPTIPVTGDEHVKLKKKKLERRKSGFSKFGPKLNISKFSLSSAETLSIEKEKGKEKGKEGENASPAQELNTQNLLSSKATASKSTTKTTPKTTPEVALKSALKHHDESKERDVKSHSLGNSFTNFNNKRRSWLSPKSTPTSRSPSPKPTPKEQPAKKSTNHDIRHIPDLPPPAHVAPPRPLSSRSSPSKFPIDPPDVPIPPVTLRRKETVLQKARRPLSVILPRTKSETNIPKSPSMHSLRQSLSSDRLSSFMRSHHSNEGVPPLPSNPSMEKLQKVGSEVFRKKDELWSVFRTLDADYQKFLTKPSALKTTVVKASLLPFISRYADHPSNNMLRPEDLDRRANILNKWWIALLELLHGKNNQSLMGTDRPAILDAAAGIMMRPEWRIAMYPTPSDSQRSFPRSVSTTSIESGGSDFLAESVYHNVRNIFTQNLLSQMAFVVEKMSLRSAPASLVTFCGKATAYAFFFCPGVAHILIRLWNIPADTVRRVLAEAGISRSTFLEDITEEIAMGFPPCIRTLSVKSVASTIGLLKRPAAFPLGAGNIPWYGPWIRRWSGAETDLFYGFTKHFHILLSGYFAEGTDNQSKIRAPGVAYVHSQILTVMDGTIHRPGSQPMTDTASGPLAVTFDDLLDGADASATALPLPPTNIVRSMAENRLIMLLRDLLAESNSGLTRARKDFALTFAEIMKAAARRTSLYDHNACFTLGDFMEEALTILFRFQQNVDPSTTVLDWPFWLDVCRKMMQSENTITEIRLFALLYSTWNIINDDPQRKRDLCLGWLLEKDFFERQFNHWCPMVRAYYHRLLCWRLARLDGEPSDLDTEILETLHERLNTVMSNFLYLEEHTVTKDGMPPSTAACAPAPGRRFVIIRNDTTPIPFGLLSLDKIVPPHSLPQTPDYRSHTSLKTLSEYEAKFAASETTRTTHANRKRWSMFKGMVPFTGQASTQDNHRLKTPPARIGSVNTDFDDSPPGSRSTRPRNSRNNSNDSGGSRSDTSPPLHQMFSFKFSLEWVDRSLTIGRSKKLYAPRLPPPAQLYIQSKNRSWYDVEAKAPTGIAVRTNIYSGRALAEWAQVVLENQNFFERRKNEGVPGNKYVETPTLGVETFRRPG
ncbi:MAG: hypothetical protein M1834_005532 [Cirrosporium novae-zelandiae]|nr:MAG: hypothetical protein M1834_005532 [Cirrosporium novae-zelandiae]